jgi:C1A family cysteine protease
MNHSLYRSLLATALLLTVWSWPTQSLAATELTREVLKNNGEVTTYKFLPVEYHPEQAQVVQARMNAAKSTVAVPASYQIPHSKLPAIRDQGQRGTCAYFATTGLLETYYMAASTANANIRLSEECLVDVRNWESDTATYTGADKPAERPDPNGDLPASIVATITTYGMPLAKEYGAVSCVYDGSNQNGGSVTMTDYQALFSSGATKAYGKGMKFNMNAKPTIDQIKALLVKNIPVEIGILVYNEFMNGSDWRFNAQTDTDSNLAGGHAIILTGYTTSGASTIFTFKNSWGDGWGNQGYGTMDDKVLTNSWGYDPNFDFIVSAK